MPLTVGSIPRRIIPKMVLGACAFSCSALMGSASKYAVLALVSHHRGIHCKNNRMDLGAIKVQMSSADHSWHLKGNAETSIMNLNQKPFLTNDGRWSDIKQADMANLRIVSLSFLFYCLLTIIIFLQKNSEPIWRPFANMRHWCRPVISRSSQLHEMCTGNSVYGRCTTVFCDLKRFYLTRETTANISLNSTFQLTWKPDKDKVSKYKTIPL